ncbi:MAG: hypothetical protein KUG61_05660 [Parvibaculaceae bacterium]|nr:hypothetical protein [Parvibaculaceae bacterium]
MICCFFAVFLLSQLLAPFRRLGHLFSGSNEALAGEQLDSAAAWRLNSSTDTPPAIKKPNGAWFRKAAVLFISIDLLIFGGIAAASSSGAQPSIMEETLTSSELTFLEDLHGSICRVFGN